MRRLIESALERGKYELAVRTASGILTVISIIGLGKSIEEFSHSVDQLSTYPSYHRVNQLYESRGILLKGVNALSYKKGGGFDSTKYPNPGLALELIKQTQNTLDSEELAELNSISASIVKKSNNYPYSKSYSEQYNQLQDLATKVQDKETVAWKNLPVELRQKYVVSGIGIGSSVVSGVFGAAVALGYRRDRRWSELF